MSARTRRPTVAGVPVGGLGQRALGVSVALTQNLHLGADWVRARVSHLGRAASHGAAGALAVSRS